MKKVFMKIIMLLVVLASLVTINTSAVMAANAPYVYSYTDSLSGKRIYSFYQYNSKSGTYTRKREFYSKGVNVYTASDILLTNSSAGNTDAYNVFDANGNFYYITKKGETVRYNLSGKKETLITSGSIRFNRDADDVGISVVTSSGTKTLLTLTSSTTTTTPVTPTPTPPSTTVTTKSSTRVDTYKDEKTGEMVHDAYKSNKIKVSIVVSKDETKVLNQTAGVRLTDTLKGAKFAGIDTSYNVYLYESNGTLYRFKYGKWYSAEKLTLSGSFKSFKTNDNGFITTFVTTKGTYSINSLKQDTKWKAKKTYAVSKSNYVTLYIKGTTTSKTLKLEKGILYLNNKKIASGVTKFGFISAKKFAYIKSNKKCYTATISKPTKANVFCTKAKSFKKSSVGLINKAVVANNKTKKIK